MSSVDIAIVQDARGLFDLSLTNGDFTTTSGFDTALPMSIFCERRADASEVVSAYRRRGWWGNLLSDDGFEIGSKLWLVDQSRRTVDTLNRAQDYAQAGLQWLVDDGHLKSIGVTGSFTSSGLSLTIELRRSRSVADSISYALWENTIGF